MGEDRRIVLITGASSGIGAELARIFARKGHDLGLVARRKDRLESLADTIEAQGGRRPLVLPCDLEQPEAVSALAKALKRAGARPVMLINNAGFGLLGEVTQSDPKAQLSIIDVNLRALLSLTLHFLPDIREARGKILNVASVVAFLPGGPRLSVYYASKSFVLSFSRSLREELRTSGVTVCALCPGITQTEFQERAGFGSKIALSWMPQMSAAEVAEAGYAGLMAGRGVITPGILNKLTAWVAPLLPASLLVPFIGIMQSKR